MGGDEGNLTDDLIMEGAAQFSDFLSPADGGICLFNNDVGFDVIDILVADNLVNGFAGGTDELAVKAAVNVDLHKGFSLLGQGEQVEFLKAVLQELGGIVPAVAAV